MCLGESLTLPGSKRRPEFVLEAPVPWTKVVYNIGGKLCVISICEKGMSYG
jgi:hypothetical protein